MSCSYPIKIMSIKFFHRLKQEKELEQAGIRLIAGFSIVLYMLVINHPNIADLISYPRVTIKALPVEIILSITYFCAILLLFAALFFRLGRSSFMRMVALLIDVTILSFAMAIITEKVLPIFFLYYWVIIGHAFRFGTKDLFAATFLSITGFLLAIATGEYWHEHFFMAAWLVISLILIPAYIGLFLSRENRVLQQLQKEKLKANAANEEKSNFLANVSHELRTPLNGVIAVGELLSNTNLIGKQKEYSDVITTSATVLRGLINNILDYSKIESGVIEIENIGFDLRDMVMKVVSILQPIANQKGITLETNIADTLPKHVYGDPTKISQILMNLANNAIKFTNYGYVVINAFPMESKERTMVVRFEIIDTGIGIPVEDQKDVFERFKQTDETITRRYGGTGLGTAISKKLTEHMGGTIGLSSEVGVGTRFWFELPLKTAKSVHPVSTQQNVIIVSQTPQYIHQLKQTIETWDYTIDIYSDYDPLQYLTNTAVDSVPTAIIIDCALAEKGSEFIAAIEPAISKFINFILLGPGRFNDKQILKSYDTILPVPIETRQLYHAMHVKAHKYDPAVTPIHAANLKKPSKSIDKLKILVCDDEQTNRFVMKEILESMGHTITLTENGFEALEQLQNNEYDLAVLDLQMPDMSGFEVAELYEYSGPHNKTPLIMATANVKADTIEKSKDYFEDFIEKPIDYQKFSAIIARLVEEKQNSDKELRVDLTRTLQTILFDPEELNNYPKNTLESGFLTSLFSIFSDSANKLLTNIKQASENGDIEAFKNHIHALRGIAGNVKAKRLEAITRQCLNLDRESFMVSENTAYIIDNLVNCVSQTNQSLFQYLKGEAKKKR